MNGGQHHSALLEGEDLGAGRDGAGGQENDQYLEFASLLGEGTYAHATRHSPVEGGMGGSAARRPHFEDPFAPGSEQGQAQGAPPRESLHWGGASASSVCKTEPVVSPSGEDTASQSSGGFVPAELGAPPPSLPPSLSPSPSASVVLH